MQLHRISNSVRQSAAELKNTRSLAVCAMLLALQVLLGMTSIPVSNTLQISFDYLPLCITGLLFGPVPAVLTGGLSDLLAFIIRPTGPFMPGFTLSAALSGLIYGLFLYRKKSTSLWPFVWSRLIAVVLCNIVLNTVWLLLAYGQGAAAWIPQRILKNVVEYPVSLILLHFLNRLLPKIVKSPSGK